MTCLVTWSETWSVTTSLGPWSPSWPVSPIELGSFAMQWHTSEHPFDVLCTRRFLTWAFSRLVHLRLTRLPRCALHLASRFARLPFLVWLLAYCFGWDTGSADYLLGRCRWVVWVVLLDGTELKHIIRVVPEGDSSIPSITQPVTI